MPPYCDPEWQAWALGGAILIPRRTLPALPEPSAKIVAATYQFACKGRAILLLNTLSWSRSRRSLSDLLAVRWRVADRLTIFTAKNNRMEKRNDQSIWCGIDD